jgi:hypothetical protein
VKTRGARALVCGVVVVIGAVAMTSCGGDSDSSVSSRDNSKETTTSLGPGKESDYIGLTKSAAIAKAKDQGRPYRITREDGESFPGTLDYNPERVQFEIDNGKVTKATFG